MTPIIFTAKPKGIRSDGHPATVRCCVPQKMDNEATHVTSTIHNSGTSNTPVWIQLVCFRRIEASQCASRQLLKACMHSDIMRPEGNRTLSSHRRGAVHSIWLTLQYKQHICSDCCKQLLVVYAWCKYTCRAKNAAGMSFVCCTFTLKLLHISYADVYGST